LEKDCIDRSRLIGELYFEYHRGTYTSQAAIKKANRKSEFLLHDLEFLAAAASGQKGYHYPGETIERLWKTVLVNQFHDILPGSSISEVYADAACDHAQVAKEASALRDQALAAWLGEGGEPAPVNTTGFARAEVMALPDGSLHLAEAPPYGPGRFVQVRHPVNVEQTAAGFVLENNYLRATLSRGGRLVSLIEKETGRESLDGESNRFLLYDDKPTNFDAWDVDPFHMETEKVCPPAETCRVSEQNPLRAAVAFEYAVGKSSCIRQTVRLDAQSRRLEFITEIDWHERQRMLKVAFDANVRSMNATCEMQFGCVERPTHFNTPYDLARYEVPAHKWVDLSEPDFGLALLSESKYGFSAFGNTLRMSLLRAPLDPDPQADQGSHQFSYALYPHASDWRQAGVVAEAYRFNVPLLLARPSANSPSSFVEIEGDLVLDTIKKAEDSDALVLRFYECQGRRGTARIRPHGPVARARLANILEEPLGDVLLRDGWIELSYRPFEIITVLVE